MPALAEPLGEEVALCLGDFCVRRIPAELRDRVRLTHEVRGTAVTLVEHRPRFDDRSVWGRSSVAQFRFNVKSKQWSLFWRDRNERWHPYEGLGPAKSLTTLLAEVDRDPTGIFWG